MAAVDTHTEHTEHAHDEEHGHPSESKYIQIAIILAVLTAIEVVLSYTEEQVGRRGTVGLLLVFAAVKFYIVAMWFMHLKFDHPWFRRLFVTGLVLAAFCYIAYLATLNVW
jgi:cytochrome c oxidase subunit IV